MLWIKNSKSKPDAMLTFSAIAFLVVILKFAAAGSSLQIKNFNVDFDDLDPGITSVILTATLGSYVSRRWMDVKYKENVEA